MSPATMQGLLPILCSPYGRYGNTACYLLSKTWFAWGGLCEGAQVIYQEDNAGPHQEEKYTEWMAEEFNKRGWKVKLQAPQGPYCNVLDLALFHSLSQSPFLSHSHAPSNSPFNSPSHSHS